MSIKNRFQNITQQMFRNIGIFFLYTKICCFVLCDVASHLRIYNMYMLWHFNVRLAAAATVAAQASTTQHCRQSKHTHTYTHHRKKIMSPSKTWNMLRVAWGQPRVGDSMYCHLCLYAQVTFFWIEIRKQIMNFQMSKQN